MGTCDVFATNFMTPVIRRYALGYEDLKKLKSDLIYAHLTGFGKNGPFREKPGFDHVAFWARSGIMKRVGKPGMPPPSQPRGLGDDLTSGFIAAAISAALLGRERTGLGQNVDLSLYHYGVWGLGMDMAFTAVQGMVEPPVTGHGAFNPLTNCYRTGDGVWVQVWCVESDKYWRDFCTALDLKDIMENPRFRTGTVRMAKSSELVAIIDVAFGRKTYSEIENRFNESGEVVFSRVHDPMDVIHDDQVWAEKFFLDVVHPDGGSVRLISSPAKFGGETPVIRKTAPRLSEDADEILAALGLTKNETNRLRETKVIL